MFSSTIWSKCNSLIPLQTSTYKSHLAICVCVSILLSSSEKSTRRSKSRCSVWPSDPLWPKGDELPHCEHGVGSRAHLPPECVDYWRLEKNVHYLHLSHSTTKYSLILRIIYTQFYPTQLTFFQKHTPLHASIPFTSLTPSLLSFHLPPP